MVGYVSLDLSSYEVYSCVFAACSLSPSSSPYPRVQAPRLPALKKHRVDMLVRAHQRVAPVKDAPRIREELRVRAGMGQPIKSWMIAATRAGIRTNRAESSQSLLKALRLR